MLGSTFHPRPYTPHYRFKQTGLHAEPARPSQQHPHWFCAQLRATIQPYPEAYRAVCAWLADLERQGHDFRS